MMTHKAERITEKEVQPPTVMRQVAGHLAARPFPEIRRKEKNIIQRVATAAPMKDQAEAAPMEAPKMEKEEMSWSEGKKEHREQIEDLSKRVGVSFRSIQEESKDLGTDLFEIGFSDTIEEEFLLVGRIQNETKLLESAGEQIHQNMQAYRESVLWKYWKNKLLEK